MKLAAVLKNLEGAADGPLTRLTHGEPAERLIASLRGETPASLIPGLVDQEAGQAVLAGIWVGADVFDEAHEVAQGLSDPWGAWWHAILHRREPDASNALYWYRRVKMPADLGTALGRSAAAALGGRPPAGLEALAAAIGKSGRWEPVPYVRAVEAAQAGHLTADAGAALVALQRLEWRAWLDHCVAAARAGAA